MDQFHHGRHVRLRSHDHGTYLHADEDGHGVNLRHRRESMNAAWAVHLYQSPNNTLYLLLHSAAYGRYLAAADTPAPLGHSGLRVEQRDYTDPEVEAVVWQAILSESEGEVYLRNIRGGCLRVNGRRWNTDASVDYVDDLDNISTKMLWVVEDVPSRPIMSVPNLPRPNGIPISTRKIRYVWHNFYGDIITRGSLNFRGRSVFRLRKKLTKRLRSICIIDASQVIMCLPTRDGRLFPLVVDLPRSGRTLHVAVVIAGSPAHALLRCPNVDAA